MPPLIPSAATARGQLGSPSLCLHWTGFIGAPSTCESPSHSPGGLTDPPLLGTHPEQGCSRLSGLQVAATGPGTTQEHPCLACVCLHPTQKGAFLKAGISYSHVDHHSPAEPQEFPGTQQKPHSHCLPSAKSISSLSQSLPIPDNEGRKWGRGALTSQKFLRPKTEK